MRNWEINKMFNELNDEALSKSETRLPVVVLAAKAKNVRVLLPYAQEYEQARANLIMQYGTVDDSGNYKVENTNKEFIAEFEKLNNMDHPELNDFIMKVKLEELPKEMLPREFELLLGMVEL